MPSRYGGMRAMGWGQSFKMALASDAPSILIMEIVDDLVMIVLPRSMDSGFSLRYWGPSWGTSLLIAFIITTPLNSALIGHDLGHQHMM